MFGCFGLSAPCFAVRIRALAAHVRRRAACDDTPLCVLWCHQAALEAMRSGDKPVDAQLGDLLMVVKAKLPAMVKEWAKTSNSGTLVVYKPEFRGGACSRAPRPWECTPRAPANTELQPTLEPQHSPSTLNPRT
eukprot:4851015-Prymnesium_polylepis.2